MDLVPISKNLKTYIDSKNLNKLSFISRGDDFQTLFTASKKDRKNIKSLSKRINHKISRIGEINNKFMDYKIFSKGNLLKPINYDGYSHKF